MWRDYSDEWLDTPRRLTSIHSFGNGELAACGDEVAVAATGVLGVLLLAVAVEGHLRGPLNSAFRLAALIGALAFIFPGWITDAVGALIAVLLFLIQPKAPPSTGRTKAT